MYFIYYMTFIYIIFEYDKELLILLKRILLNNLFILINYSIINLTNRSQIPVKTPLTILTPPIITQ
jgi:hypothetical protein